jgi:hypothetical protein
VPRSGSWIAQLRGHRPSPEDVRALPRGGDAKRCVVVVERRQQIESRLRASHHRECDGVVERDHRIGRDAFEQLVQGENLWPVGVLWARRLPVDRRDGRLELALTGGYHIAFLVGAVFADAAPAAAVHSETEDEPELADAA